MALSFVAFSSPSQAQSCPGDCAGSGSVSIPGLIIGINIALGEDPLSRCPSFDINGDGRVRINEVIAAVRAALNGCP